MAAGGHFTPCHSRKVVGDHFILLCVSPEKGAGALLSPACSLEKASAGGHLTVDAEFADQFPEAQVAPLDF